MKLAALPNHGLRLVLTFQEAALLDLLVGQLTDLLRSHSETELDPDPLFASLEVGGSEVISDDPALARLFPDAYDTRADSATFRRVTEQGLINRKMQDAGIVSRALGLGEVLSGRMASGDLTPSDLHTFDVDISPDTLPSWVRTITSLRLAIAARIGLNSAADYERLRDDDETHGTVAVFDWLAAILESALMMHGNVIDEDRPEAAAPERS